MVENGPKRAVSRQTNVPVETEEPRYVEVRTAADVLCGPEKGLYVDGYEAPERRTNGTSI